jgi:hypothetical protein
MPVHWLVLACAGAVVASAAATVDPGAVSRITPLTAAQIVDRNIDARGGLEAWRKIQTMIWIGHIQSPHGPTPSLPFTMVQKRPNKTHFEVNVMGQKTLRVFDGVAGWKVRAKGDGSLDVQPFPAQDARYARDGQGIDGPLLDAEAKGNTIELEGTDEVEGRNAYRLGVRFASGQTQHVWVDAQSFLEIKSDRSAFTAAGKLAGPVATYYRDYKPFAGVQLPTTIETGVGSGQGTDRMVIERVVINAPVEDRAFTRAAIGAHQHKFAQGSGAGANQNLAPMAAPNPPIAPGAEPGSAPR